MSQNDLTIANQGFASFRSDLNSALQALGSTNSGTSAPSTTFANQLFYDTTNNILKIRNEDNDAFISLFTLDQSNDNIESLTINGAFACEGFTSSGIDDNADAIALTIDSGENLAIGVTSKNSANDGSLTIGHTGMTKITGTANGNADELVLIGANASANVGMSMISNNANQGIIYFGDEDDTDIGGIIYDHSTNDLVFQTNTSEKVRVKSGGDLSINDGNLVIGTSGHGIDFSATSDATGMTNELLDDYEIGNYTPTVGGSTSGSYTVGDSATKLSYTKIGRMVHLQGQIHITGKSSPSGVVNVSLPFASGNTTDLAERSVGSVAFDSASSSDGVAHNSGNFVNFMVSSNSSVGIFRSSEENTGAGSLNQSHIDTNDRFTIGITYMTFA